GEPLVGQCGARREAVQIEDLTKVPPHPLFEMHLKAGVRALLAVPLLHQDKVVGALVVRRKRIGAFASETVSLLESFASQSAIAIHNSRLLHEIEEKGRQLEIASQHKSQFMGALAAAKEAAETARDTAERARAEAEAANQAKSTFLATMSHEIRTPINGVLGMLEILERQGLNEVQRRTVSTMRESGEALLHIIEKC